MELWTQYTYEKRWTITTQKEALKMIEEEMPEADAKSTLNYILTEIKKGKTITLGECRFKIENKIH
jgi:phosphotransferase system HPr-like phosphotransfer protein